MTSTARRSPVRSADTPPTPARAFLSFSRENARSSSGSAPTPMLRPRSGSGVPDERERAVLAATFGAALRQARRPSGMSQRTLAERAGVSKAMVEYLEVGRRRPTPSMVRALATGLCRPTPPLYSPPPELSELVARLTAAAGGSLVVDTPGGVRRRERRLRAAGWAYVRLARRWQAAREAEQAGRAQAVLAAFAVLDDRACSTIRGGCGGCACCWTPRTAGLVGT